MLVKIKIQSLIQTSLNSRTCACQDLFSSEVKKFTDFVYFDIGREKIEDFLDNIERPFGRDKVRIKLNNERKIADERKKMRLAEIGA